LIRVSSGRGFGVGIAAAARRDDQLSATASPRGIPDRGPGELAPDREGDPSGRLYDGEAAASTTSVRLSPSMFGRRRSRLFHIRRIERDTAGKQRLEPFHRNLNTSPRHCHSGCRPKGRSRAVLFSRTILVEWSVQNR
jgi:hypothetical protein